MLMVDIAQVVVTGARTMDIAIAVSGVARHS
jgi:hypothetical protein